MYHCGTFNEIDLMNWEKTPAAGKTYANAKTYFQEKYKVKIMYQKAAKNMGYVNNASEVNNQIFAALEQIAAAARQDHQYVNAATEAIRS